MKMPHEWGIHYRKILNEGSLMLVRGEMNNLSATILTIICTHSNSSLEYTNTLLLLESSTMRLIDLGKDTFTEVFFQI